MCGRSDGGHLWKNRPTRAARCAVGVTEDTCGRVGLQEQ